MRRFPRFSLRSSLLALLTIASTATFIFQYDPWTLLLRFPAPQQENHRWHKHSNFAFSPDNQYLLFAETISFDDAPVSSRRTPESHAALLNLSNAQLETWAPTTPHALPQGLDPILAWNQEYNRDSFQAHLPTGRTLRTLKHSHFGPSQHPDWHLLQEPRQPLRFENLRTGESMVLDWLPPTEWVGNLNLSKDQKRLFYNGALWNLETRTVLYKPEGYVQTGFYSPGGRWFVFGRRATRIVDTETGHLVPFPEQLDAGLNEVNAFSPDDNWFAGSTETGVHVFQIGAEIRRSFTIPTAEGFGDPRMTGKNSLLVSHFYKGQSIFRLYDFTTGALLTQQPLQDSTVGDLQEWNDALILGPQFQTRILLPDGVLYRFDSEFARRSPDNRTALCIATTQSASAERGYQFRDFQSGEFLFTLPGEPVDHFAPPTFSPDGTRLAIDTPEGVHIYRKNRDERLWGLLTLPILWITIGLLIAFCASLRRDRHDLP